MPYFRLFQDYLTDVGIVQGPDLDSRISFLEGKPIDSQLPSPLMFELSGPPNVQPGHFLGGPIPIVSDLFLKTIMMAGVDNFQSFAAILRHNEDGREWSGYYAFNVIGILNSMDLDKSTADSVIPEGALPGLFDFENPVIDSSKTEGLPMFRELRDPTMLIVDSRIVDALFQNKPDDGWSIMAAELEES